MNSFDKKKLEITPASFKIANNLTKAIERAIATSPLKLNVDQINFTDVFKSKLSEGALGEMIKSVLHIFISDEVENIAFQCALRALYDNQKVDEDFFEKEENRSLYYPIMFEIIKVNVSPFSKSLLSLFGGLLKTNKTSSQK